VKCADISDDVFMAAVAVTRPTAGCWRMRWDVKTTLEQALEMEVPEKLLLAKARKLGFKGRLECCTDCSCRGDYHLPRECKAYGCCYIDEGEKDWAATPGYDPSWEDDVQPGDGEVLGAAVMEAVRQVAGG
jgi:hypothetical protein